MNEILTINYESENPTVSARELHEKLHIGTKFTTWFERMKEYGFSEGKEFFPKLGETSEQGGRPQTDFEISVDMAKQICMIQRSPEGKQIRQYFIDLENASKAYISGIIEREREKMDKKKDLIQMLEKIQNPNHLAMVYGFVKRMYLEEQKEREKKHE